jgi:hypothetical protein
VLIIDRTQRTWAALSIATCAIATGVYVIYAMTSLNGPSGGSLTGLIFGIIAAAMMIFAGLLAVRRRYPAARLGSAQFWLRGHLWIGTLTVPFALFHAGFGWGGRLELLLWLLFFAVVLSGFWGLALQQILPRMMLEQIPRETFLEQIPHLCLRFTAESDRLLAEVCGPLEVPSSPAELQEFHPHLRAYFEEDRKKNRNDYSKAAPEAEQFQTFLSKVYAGVKLPASQNAAEAVPQQATTHPSATPPTPPVLKSDAPLTAPESAAQAPLPTTLSSETSAPSKPDPKAMLAAMKAKREAAAAGPVGTENVLSEVTLPPKSDTPPLAEPPVVPAKPDPKAMLAALKAKKEAAAAGLAPPTAPAETPQANPSVPLATGDAPVAPAKPDPQAMLAAMKAKKEAALAAAASEPAVAKANPLAALRQVKEAAEALPSLASATKIAPPSAVQVSELRQFYLELIRPQLPLCAPSRGWMEKMRQATLACRIRQNSVHPRFVAIFDRLHDVCEQRRQFAFVQRYHRWLHGWLLVHIPATVALYVILAIHVVTALRVIPFGN